MVIENHRKHCNFSLTYRHDGEKGIAMKALLLDTVGKTTTVVNPEGLEDYYKMINCRCIDIVTRKIGRKWYDIICDDEGTFVEDPLISAIDNLGRAMLVGNLIICGLANDEGELTDLDANDILYIKKRIQPMYTRRHIDEPLLMLTQCTY